MTTHYQDERLTLLHGDAVEQVSKLDAGSVQTVVTSPPYFGLRDYDADGQYGTEATVADFAGRLVALFREIRRALSDDGTVWLNLGDSYANDGKWGGSSGGKHAAALHGKAGPGRARRDSGLPPKSLMGVPWRVAFALQDDGWILRSDIIWHKPSPMPEPVADRPTKSHEYLFLLAKSPQYFYDLDAVAEPTIGEPGGQRNRRTVWTVPTSTFRGAHFATFPSELVRPCVRAGSRPGDTVLDPFSGSGTTGMVALQEGRKYVGVDLNVGYLDLSLRERFQEQPLDIFGDAA